MNKIKILIFVITLVLFLGSCITEKNTVGQNAQPEGKPVIQVISPLNNSQIFHTLKIVFHLKNFQNQIQEIRLILDDSIASVIKQGEFQFIVDISYMADQSKHQFYIEVFDNKGGIARSDILDFIINQNIVDILFRNFDKYSSVDSPYILDPVILSKIKINRIVMKIDNNFYKEVFDFYKEMILDSLKIKPGQHELSCVLYDINGEAHETTVYPFTMNADQQNQGTSDQDNDAEKQSNEQQGTGDPVFIYPQDRQGVHAATLKCITQYAVGKELWISTDIDFNRIIAKVAIQENSMDLSMINQTGIYFLKIKDEKQEYSIIKIGFIKDETVYIPADKYMMGDDVSTVNAEKPGHEVQLSSFYVSKFETTIEEFIVFLKVSNYKNIYQILSTTDKEKKYPATFITWSDAKAFCQWLGVRLLHEAEWEYLSKGKFNNLYSWGSTDKGGNSKSPTDGYEKSAPVQSYEPNIFGIYNLSGNVWEWCEDWYDPYYYTYSPLINPLGPKNGTTKVVRGGSFLDDLFYLRSITRGAINPNSMLVNVGMRIAKNY